VRRPNEVSVGPQTPENGLRINSDFKGFLHSDDDLVFKAPIPSHERKVGTLAVARYGSQQLFRILKKVGAGRAFGKLTGHCNDPDTADVL
jgi:hypothetical protein